MSRNNIKPIVLYTLVSVCVCVLEYSVSFFAVNISMNCVYANSSEENSGQARKSASRNKKAMSENNRETDEADSIVDISDFPEESVDNRSFFPDVYRCPECGYEQDEEGVCPDHFSTELVKILSRGRNPIAPLELDGNEDIIVDVPLRNLEFNKNVINQDTDDSVPQRPGLRSQSRSED